VTNPSHGGELPAALPTSPAVSATVTASQGRGRDGLSPTTLASLASGASLKGPGLSPGRWLPPDPSTIQFPIKFIDFIFMPWPKRTSPQRSLQPLRRSRDLPRAKGMVASWRRC